MRVHVDIKLPTLPKRRRWRIGAALAVALALVVPGIALAGFTTFNDVPPSNPFYNDIAAIADAGVTGGCGGGNYCPTENVTREQMAAFMNRLGALGPGKTPVVNADKLDGIDSGQFLPSGSPPGGTTIRGSYALGGSPDGAYGWDSIDFGAMLPQAPTVHFLEVGDPPTATCSGSSENPLAQPGHLCVYEAVGGNVADHYVFETGTGVEGATRFGAAVIVYTASPDDFYSYGTWAVTVPFGIVAGPPADSDSVAPSFP